jgi:benzil reductase ((S)-benzoin forming)
MVGLRHGTFTGLDLRRVERDRGVSIAPGTVDTDMQAAIRKTSEDDFPNRQRFFDLHKDGKLTPPEEVARNIWSLLEGDFQNGSVVDLRELVKR